MFNLRGEPVLFVRDGFDMVPYSPRHQDRLSQCVTGETQTPQQCTQLECQLRKEVSNHWWYLFFGVMTSIVLKYSLGHNKTFTY